MLTQQIYSEETNGAHAHYREPVPLKALLAVPVLSLGKVRLRDKRGSSNAMN